MGRGAGLHVDIRARNGRRIAHRIARNDRILVDRDSAGEPNFLLQARAFEHGEEPRLDLPVAMSLVSEDVIVFCPWCGVPLRRFYRKDIDALIRPALRIHRGD